MSKPLVFRDDQQQALDLKGGKLVVAGAGSGKTTVLAERYLRLLDPGGLHPREIVATTFTNKAAASLRSRIHQCLLDREAEQPDRADRWRRLRGEMQFARIGTLDSFCGSLLRAWPHESGVDPEFAVGPKPQAERTRMLRSHLRDLAFQRDEHLHAFLGAFAKERNKRAEQLLLALLERPDLRRALRAAERDVAAADTYLRDQGRALLERFAPGEMPDIPPGIHRAWLEASLHGLAIVEPLLDPPGTPRASLTFADVEYLTLELLQSGTGAARRIRASIRALLVDEFQDISTLQWQIIQLLVAGEDSRVDRSRLFLVGDEKQSVYGFRKADVTVLNRVRELVDGGKTFAEVPLSGNFRSLPNLLRALNPVLERLLGLLNYKDAPFVAPPQTLVPCRDDEAPGAFETTLVVGGDNGAGMKYIVSWLQQHASLVGDSVRRNSHDSDTEKEIFAYRDIAILLRKRTHLPALELALQVAAIPYSVQAGRGFYSRPEVLDMIHLVRAFADPRDQLARVAVLRGPVFSLPDTAVAALFFASDGATSVWDNWIESGEESGLLELLDLADRAALALARPLWLALRQLVGRTDPVSWLRLALDCSGAWGAYSVGRRGRQALANLGRFLDLVREFVQEQGPDLRLLNERLRLEQETVEGGDNDAEADVSAGQGVQIMTIHAAKGLEFPLVILPLSDTAFANSGRKLPRGGNLLLEEHDLRPLTDACFFQLARDVSGDAPTIHKVMLDHSSPAEEKAEELRLLYVAATRARDRLLVVPHAKIKSGKLEYGKDSLTEFWLKACDLDRDRFGESYLAANSEVTGERDGQKYLKTESGMRFRWVSAPDISVAEVQMTAAQLPPQPPEPSVAADPSVRFFAPARTLRLEAPLEAFAAWVANPSDANREKLLHLGRDETGEDSMEAGEESGEMLWPASNETQRERTIVDGFTDLQRLGGILLHQVVQRYGPRVTWSGAESWVQEHARAMVPDTTRRRQLIERARTLVEACNAAKLDERFAERRELPVLLRLGELTLRGRIDLAWRQDDLAVALDLKTNDVKPDGVDELMRNHGYDHQACLYAMAYAGSLDLTRAEGRLLFLPSGIEKRVPVTAGLRRMYLEHATELVSLAGGIRLSPYPQESMK